MDKIAQERGLLNKLREHADITGKLLESINPKFHKMMADLRATDEKIRQYAAQSKDLIKSAKSLVNRKDYLSAASTMSAFHERCRYIAAELENFVKNIDLDSYEILLNQFDDEQKERIFGYDPNKSLNLNDVSFAKDLEILAALEKKAGLSDWWHNLTDERAKAMKALEKRFSVSFLKDIKNNSINMFNESQRFLQFLLNTFSKLAIALAKRKPSQYIELAKLFSQKFLSYHKSFVKYYDKNIKPLKEQNDKMIAAKKQEEEILQAKKLKEEQEAAMKHQQEMAGSAPSKQDDETLPIDLTKPSQNVKNKALNNLDKLHEEKEATQFIEKIEKIAKGMQENPQVYYQIGKDDGKEDLENYGSGSDIINSLLSRIIQVPIPMDKEYFMSYANGYADGSEMNELNKNKELEKVKHYIAKYINENSDNVIESNSSKLLMLEILKYSEKLESSNPELSLKLLAIAEGIKEDNIF